MAEGTFVALVQNAALLLVMALVYDVGLGSQGIPLARIRQVGVGVLVGVTGIAIMLTPFEYAPGIVFDTRSVLLGIAGLFFGVIPTAVAMALTAALRLSQGGAGAWTGVAAIVASGCLGIAWRRRRRGLEDLSLRECYLFGVVVHAVMLALMFTLPWAVAVNVIGAIGLPVIVIYPVATALLAGLTVNRLRREKLRGVLEVNEERLRVAADAADLGLYDLNLQTGESIVNARYARMLGYDPADFLETIAAATERTHPDDREAMAAAYEDYCAGKLPQYEAEFRHRTRSGDWKWILTLGRFVERDAQGAPLRMLGTHVDISARKQAEEQARAAAEEAARMLEAEIRSRRALLSIVEDQRASEAALRESETRYRSLVMYSPDATLVNRDDRVALVNDACLRLFGAQRDEELLGKPTRELFHPGDHALIRERMHRLRETGRPVGPVEEHIVRLDGRVVDVEATATTFEDRGSRDVLVILRDITERMRAEEQRLARLRFAESMDRVNQAIQRTDDLDQTMRDTLDAVLALLDCDRAWFLYPCDPDAPSFRVPMEVAKPGYPGAGILNVDVPLPPDMAQNLREALESADPVIYAAGTDHPINKVSAEQFGVQSQMFTALYPKSGKPWAFGIHQCSYPRVWTSEEEDLFKEIGRRLTDALTSLLARRELRASEAGLRDAQRIAHVGNWRLDIRRNVLDGSDESYQIFGIEIGRPMTYEDFLDRVHPDDRAAVDRAWTAALSGARYDVENRIVVAGVTKWVREQAELTFDAAGNTIEAIGTVQDITERKQAEAEVRQLNEELEQRVAERTAKLEAANKDLESFSYSVSHDLRAPLRAISGFASILARRYRDGLDEKGRHYVDTIVDSSEHMGVLIDELLDYSRIGRRMVRAEPVPLGPLVAQLRVTFGDRIAASGAELEVVEPLATPVGDPTLLERILVNLVDNALTYHRSDVATRVTLSATHHGRRVALAVADNGIGIPPEYRERIFEVFARLHADEEYPGTGIGLSIARKAARLMGGDVAVESTEGVGSTFSLELPAATKRSSQP